MTIAHIHPHCAPETLRDLGLPDRRRIWIEENGASEFILYAMNEIGTRRTVLQVTAPSLAHAYIVIAGYAAQQKLYSWLTP